MDWTFEQFLVDVGFRSDEYTYTREELRHPLAIEHYRKCFRGGMGAYKALLYLENIITEIRTKQEKP